MRARWFLVIGIGIGAVAAGARLLLSPRPVRTGSAPTVVGTRLFEGVFEYVRDFAVDSLDAQELYRRAASGVIEELDDPYAFLVLPGQQVPSPDSASAQGVYLDRRDGGVVVVATVPGSPADSAGVRTGDFLVTVDSMPVDAGRLDRVVSRLQGEPGTRVTLRLRRAGVRGLVALDVVRKAPVLPPAISAAVLPGGVGHLQLRRFVPGAADSVRQAVARLQTEGARSLALDLRGSVGGALADGAAMADLFLDSSATLVVSRGRPGTASTTLTDSSRAVFPSLPLTVLVNAGTAGAAEVVAGALQDHDRAAVLGATTFGRGVTQSSYPLGNGISLRLTTALWMTPSGRQIQRPPETLPDTATRPRSRSDAGRALQGGGGIVPDRIVSDTGVADLVLAEARRILLRASSVRSVLGLVVQP